jgi:ERCC4-type nuclease
MQEIRGKRKEDTNITELATLCMAVQKTKAEREQKIATGKWEQKVKILQEKLHKTEQDMRIVKREKENALKILKSLRKMMTATQLELTKLEKIHKENKIITQIWKDLNEDKERELELQKEYIKRLENEKQ